MIAPDEERREVGEEDDDEDEDEDEGEGATDRVTSATGISLMGLLLGEGDTLDSSLSFCCKFRLASSSAALSSIGTGVAALNGSLLLESVEVDLEEGVFPVF